jgi:hypothetical protein
VQDKGPEQEPEETAPRRIPEILENSFVILQLEPIRRRPMRALSKMSYVIAALAAVALTASAADARQVNTARLAGAHNSVSAPGSITTPGSGHIPYDADGVPFPSGHGTTSNSPDFQLMR